MRGERRPRPLSEPWARRWLDRFEQPALGFALLRIYLGLGLIVRGALFVANPAVIQRVLGDADGWALPFLGAHVIAGVHLVGGALLMCGYLTRFAAAIQVPVLFGAAFLVHFREGLFSSGQSFEFSLLVLVLLALYSLFGAGPLSLDEALRRRELLSRMTDAKQAPRAAEELPTAAASLPWDAVDEASWESFPASDPPAITIGAPRQPQSPLFAARGDDPTHAHYADARFELLCVTAAVLAFSLLLAFDQYGIAALGLTGATIMFGVWRIGRANFA